MAFGAPNSPQRLVWLTMAGGLVSSVAWLAFESMARQTTWQSFVVGVLGLGSFYFFMKSARNLRDSVDNQQWSAEEIAPLRKAAGAAWVNALFLSLFVALTIALIMGHSGHRKLGAGFWPIFILILALRQIVEPFKRRIEPSTTPNFGDAAPLQSEHWGNN